MHHRLVRAKVLEQIGPCILQAVLHGKADVDDVFVFGQHGRVAQSGGLPDRAASHVNRAQLRHAHCLMRLEGIREAPLEPGVRRVAVLPEGSHDGLLTFLDDKETAAQPHKHGHPSDQASTDASLPHVARHLRAITRRRVPRRRGARGLLPEKPIELAVEIAPEFVEIRRALVSTIGHQASLHQVQWGLHDAPGALKRRLDLAAPGRTAPTGARALGSAGVCG